MPRLSAVYSAGKLDDAACSFRRTGSRTVFQDDKAILSLIDNFTGSGEFYAFAELRAVGEITIDNRAEIRRELNIEGGANLSDGELLLRFYAARGIAAFSQIRGMFVAVIYDGDDLLIVRDGVGARTIFYTQAGNDWAVSTSLLTLRRWRKLDARLNLAAVRSFLIFAYLPGDETLLEDVRELLPAHVLRIARNGASELINYYEPSEDFAAETSSATSAANLRNALEEVVESMLPPENQEIAVFLSGGIDSSLVTALAARQRPGKVRAYSLDFGANSPNETAYAELVAAHCGVRHQTLTFGGEQIAAHLNDAVALLDCPVGDPLTVPNLLLARAAARDGLRTAFNGEGGDPCFGGPKNLPMLIADFHRAKDVSPSAIYLNSYRKCFEDLPLLLTPEALSQLAAAPSPERFVAPFLENARMKSFLNRLLYTNIRTKLAHHILPKVERLTASCGLLGRSPLADQRIVDASFAVAPNLKLKGSVEKWILKEAVRDLLPATIVDRPKSGMRVPVQTWLGGALRRPAKDLLLGKRAAERGLFNPQIIRAWTRGENLIYARHGGKLWLLLTLELALRTFIDDAN